MRSEVEGQAEEAAPTVDRASSAPAGFRHPDFARSFSEFGSPIELPRAGGWILARPIPGTDRRDAIGLYPITVLRDWSALEADLADLPPDLVSLTLVADPFGRGALSALSHRFGHVRPLSPHYVIDLSASPQPPISARHRRETRQVLRDLDVDVVTDAGAFVDEWTELYRHTIRRHDVSGLRAFSRDAFAQQLLVPGVSIIRARRGGQVEAAYLWVQDEDVAYGYLGGISPEGYVSSAAHAIFWTVFEWYSGRCAWIDLGGVPTVGSDLSDGLRTFKARWATGTVPVYLCGAILDQKAYAELAAGRDDSASSYFPAYRAREAS